MPRAINPSPVTADCLRIQERRKGENSKHHALEWKKRNSRRQSCQVELMDLEREKYVSTCYNVIIMEVKELISSQPRESLTNSSRIESGGTSSYVTSNEASSRASPTIFWLPDLS